MHSGSWYYFKVDAIFKGTVMFYMIVYKMGKNSLGLYFRSSIVGVGIVSIAAQVILFRELFSLLEGNELIISISMFVWLFSGGIGSLAAKYLPPNMTLYIIFCLFSGLLPPYLVFLARYLYAEFFLLGFSPGLWGSILFLLITTAPYSFLIGILLPFAQKVSFERKDAINATKVYILDNTGDITGAFLVSLLLIVGIKILPIVFISATIVFLSIIFISIQYSRLLGFLLLCIISFLIYLPINQEYDFKSIKYNYPNLVNYEDSVYGRVAVTESKGEITIWESGFPYIVPGNIVDAEEKIHYILSQLEKIENVLLISGYSKETITELFKHSPKKVDYVELDPLLIDIAKQKGILEVPDWVHVHSIDAKKYVDKTQEYYDAIIMDLPLPSTFQTSRMYSKEFLSKAKKVLADGGIISFSMDYNPNYLSPLEKEILGIIVATVKSVFSNHLLLPGERLYILASDSELNWDIPSLLKEKGITTQYIEGYFYGNTTKERIQVIQGQFSHSSPNTLLNSRIIRAVIYEWFSKINVNPKFIFLFVILAFLTCLFLYIKTHEIVMFSSGFFVMGIEILVLYLFQVVHGYVYVALSIIIGTFLLGLLPGALIGMKMRNYRKGLLILTDLSLLCFSFLLLLSMLFNLYYCSMLLYLLYCFSVSLVAGIQFPLLAKLSLSQRIPYRLFSADLMGAGLGVIIVGGILAPFSGLIPPVFCLIGLKIVSIIRLLWRT